jgi:Sulfotransferase domain
LTHPDKYLIIGGSTKCGTTSLFKYFEFHPEVCACRMKESRFFLDASYLMQATGRDHGDQEYGSLFNGCAAHKTGLEATPDYLYSAEAALRISKELEDVRVVFILRDPSDRLISWYRFAKMNGLISKGMSIDEYVAVQRNAGIEKKPQHLRALEQGNYAHYIEPFIKALGKDRVGIYFYEHMASDPGKFCRELSVFAGLDPSYFNTYNFRIFNRSADTRSAALHRLFRKFKRTIRPATRQLPGDFRKKLKLAGHSMEESVLRFNTAGPDNNIQPLPETVDFLQYYYKPGVEQLITIHKGAIPWRQY